MRKLRKWGATRSQRQLDRRIEKIQAQMNKLGLDRHQYLDARAKELREEADEDKLRLLIEKYEGAATRAIQGALLERELLSYLAAEIVSGRLNTNDFEEYALAIDNFYHRKPVVGRSLIVKARRFIEKCLAYYRR